MKKKKSSGGGANWMDTYGDMVTLLLCFFVLLYSMSTISEENWKALVMSFNPQSVQIPTASEGGDGPSADGDQSGVMPDPQEEIDEDINDLYEALKAYASEGENQNALSVTKGDGKVYISFSQTAFFDGYSYTLRQESLPILDEVSNMFSNVSDSIDEIQIIGHTARDNPDRPNSANTDRFLASNRATNVLVYIQEHSTVDAGRLVSLGVGEWHPVGTNETSEGRQANRRVELVVSGRNLEEEAALEGSMESYTTHYETEIDLSGGRTPGTEAGNGAGTPAGE